MIPTFSSPLLALQSRLLEKGEKEDALEPYSHWGMRMPCSPDPEPLILDPLLGHPEASRHVTNLNLRGTIKELAQLDGGFVVSHDGIVLSACRYLDAVAAEVDVPLGLGSRHIAAANMSAVTEAVGIVVSESSVVRLFCHGQLVGEIIPEVWMMDHAAHLRGTVKREQVGELTVLTPDPRQASTARSMRAAINVGSEKHDGAAGVPMRSLWNRDQ